MPAERRRVGPRWITLTGAREHNLKDVDVKIPLGAVTAVTGVSGSGKSTLIHDVLLRALETRLHGEHSAKQHLGERVGAFDIDHRRRGDRRRREHRPEPDRQVAALESRDVRQSVRRDPAHLRRRAAVARAPVHGGHVQLQRRRRPLRDLRGRGLSSRSRWCSWPTSSCRATTAAASASSRRCSTCGCNGKNVYEVLELTIDEAIRFFPREEKLGQALWQLQQVGLGYLRLGQPATTLSGGEAQRLKIARELVFTTKKSGKKLYVMDEPTTGPPPRRHPQARTGVRPTRRRRTHARDLIEHNLDVIKLADWVIDLGPDAGDRGGAGRRHWAARGGRARRRARTPDSGCAPSCRAFAEHEARRPRRNRPKSACPRRFKSMRAARVGDAWSPR